MILSNAESNKNDTIVKAPYALVFTQILPSTEKTRSTTETDPKLDEVKKMYIESSSKFSDGTSPAPASGKQSTSDPTAKIEETEPSEDIWKTLFNTGSKIASRMVTDFKDSDTGKNLTQEFIGRLVGGTLIPHSSQERTSVNNKNIEASILDFLVPKAANVAQTVIKGIKTKESYEKVTSVTEEPNKNGVTREVGHAIPSSSSLQENNVNSFGTLIVDLAKTAIGQIGSATNISSDDAKHYLNANVMKPVMKMAMKEAMSRVLEEVKESNTDRIDNRPRRNHSRHKKTTRPRVDRTEADKTVETNTTHASLDFVDSKRYRKFDGFTEDRLLKLLSTVMSLLEDVKKDGRALSDHTFVGHVHKSLRQSKKSAPQSLQHVMHDVLQHFIQNLGEKMMQSAFSGTGKSVARSASHNIVQFPVRFFKNFISEYRVMLTNMAPMSTTKGLKRIVKKDRRHKRRPQQSRKENQSVLRLRTTADSDTEDDTVLNRIVPVKRKHNTPQRKPEKKHLKKATTSTIDPFEVLLESPKTEKYDYVGWIIGLSILSFFVILGVICIICYRKKRRTASLY